MANYKQLLKKINTFILDVDGVLTDGIVILSPDGDLLRTMNVKDGYAMNRAVKNGFNIAVISGGRSELVRKRFNELGVNDVFLGIKDKMEVFRRYTADKGIEPGSILYMGDDIPDYEIMKAVGVATCPSDAAEEIKVISKYISGYKGGEGCVRDVVEQVLKVQNKWFDRNDIE